MSSYRVQEAHRSPAEIPRVNECAVRPRRCRMSTNARRTSDKPIFSSRRLSLAQHGRKSEKQGEKNHVVDKKVQQVGARLRIAGAGVDAQGDKACE